MGDLFIFINELFIFYCNRCVHWVNKKNWVYFAETEEDFSDVRSKFYSTYVNVFSFFGRMGVTKKYVHLWIGI